jgi:hypothetical protein
MDNDERIICEICHIEISKRNKSHHYRGKKHKLNAENQKLKNVENVDKVTLKKELEEKLRKEISEEIKGDIIKKLEKIETLKKQIEEKLKV